MVYKEVGDHIYDVDVASEHDIQQRAVFLIFPILALVIGQFTAIRGFFWDWVPSW